MWRNCLSMLFCNFRNALLRSCLSQGPSVQGSSVQPLSKTGHLLWSHPVTLLLIQQVFTEILPPSRLPALWFYLNTALNLSCLYVCLTDPLQDSLYTQGLPTYLIHLYVLCTSKILTYLLNWTKFNVLHKNARFCHKHFTTDYSYILLDFIKKSAKNAIGGYV